MTRQDYEKRFLTFPDVVTINEFRAMLGGIGECTARKLLRGNHVEHFYIRGTYNIPKVKVILRDSSSSTTCSAPTTCSTALSSSIESDRNFPQAAQVTALPVV